MKFGRIIAAWSIILFVGSWLPVLAASRSGEAPLTIGISIPTADHGWTGGIVWWAEKAVKEMEAKYPKVKFVLHQSEDYVSQITGLEEMLAQNLTGLVILPHNPPHLANILRKVQSEGIFIVIVDRTSPSLVRDAYVAGDNYSIGRLAGEYLANNIQGKGQIVVMEGIPCDVNTLRVNGFLDVINKYPDIQVLDSQPAFWSEEKGYELMEQYLRTFPHIDAAWCGDDDVLRGALSAYDESGRQDLKLLLGCGGSKDIVKMIIDHHPLVQATVTYPPQVIYQGIEVAADHLVEGRAYDKDIIFPSRLATRENARDFYFPDSIY